MSNSIEIAASPDTVFWLAARVERWPEILPHYRFVHVLSGTDRRRIVEMAARRDRLPVRWVSIQEIDPEVSRIGFRHIRGATQGMVVEWRIRATETGCSATLWHRFEPPWWRGGEVFARYVVGDLFVENIANKTLRCLRQRAEEIALGGGRV